MIYDFQNIVYSAKNAFRTKNIIIDYNNKNRLEQKTFFSALIICMAFVQQLNTKILYKYE